MSTFHKADSVSTDVDLGVLHTAATRRRMSERGYDALLGDPFGVDVVNNNLGVADSLACSYGINARTRAG